MISKLKWQTLALWSALLAALISNWERLKSQLSTQQLYFWIYAGLMGLFMGLTLIYAIGLMPEFLSLLGIHVQ